MLQIAECCNFCAALPLCPGDRKGGRKEGMEGNRWEKGMEGLGKEIERGRIDFAPPPTKSCVCNSIHWP